MSQRSSIRAPHRQSRRSFLLVSALMGAGVPLLAACRDDASATSTTDTADATGTPDATSAGGDASDGQGGPAVPGPTTPTDSQQVEAHIMGHAVSVKISPLVRMDESTTIMTLDFTRHSDDISMDVTNPFDYGAGLDDDRLTINRYLESPALFSPYRGADGVRLIDTGTGRVWVATTGTGRELQVKPGEKATSCVFFGPLDVETVIAFIPQTGFVTLGVVDRDTASRAGVDLATMDSAVAETQASYASNKPKPELSAPAVIERYTRALDDSSGTLKTDKDVTITLASDVTFDSDSADLTSAADAQLQAVADQIAQYPDGGNLDIVGHTDDVQDDAYNQTLSEKRANAVKDRLGGLSDLSKWTVTVTGKGETEPLVDDTTDEARTANRRVEITLTPTGGTTNGNTNKNGGKDGGGPPTPFSLPTQSIGTTAVGRGPDGVTVTDRDGKGQVTITLDRLIRTGGYLVGTLTVVTGPGGTSGDTLNKVLDDPDTIIENNRKEDSSANETFFAGDGMTILTDTERVFPADYLDGEIKVHIPLAETALSDELDEGATTTVCCVWPDTGADTVTIDHKGNPLLGRHFPFQLTDIPVVDA